MKKYLFLLTLFLGVNTMNAQFERPRNAIYLDLLGNASIISLSYETHYPKSSSFMMSTRIGLGYNEEFQLCLFGPCEEEPQKFMTVPMSLTANWGWKRHFFEFGLGATIVSGGSIQIVPYPVLGYRYAPLKSKRFSLRIFSNLYPNPATSYILVPVGLSLGLSLN